DFRLASVVGAFESTPPEFGQRLTGSEQVVVCALPRFAGLLFGVRGASEVGFCRFHGRGVLRLFPGDAGRLLFRCECSCASGMSFVVRRSWFVVRGSSFGVRRSAFGRLDDGELLTSAFNLLTSCLRRRDADEGFEAGGLE